ncbi:hypothetical protein Ancab_004041 [Ancistrocladus abbreviatus]
MESELTISARLKGIQQEKVQVPKSKTCSRKRKSKKTILDNQNHPGVLVQGSSQANELSLSSNPFTPIFRQFWKAGNYNTGLASEAAIQNCESCLRVHPQFLHSNATSHKWAFGAIAELLDNAVDEIEKGATHVIVDKISNPLDGRPALLIQDDGGGMDLDAMRRCMSFGYSDKKLELAIGQYGNGFKTSSMRLGADVIVFSRHMDQRKRTQSIGLLSYTFLIQMGYDRIVVPMVDYELNMSTKAPNTVLSSAREHFLSNMSILLQWSPFSTEEQLLKQFDDIGEHGTKIIIYNLWLNNEGQTELDFDKDEKDIRIRWDPQLLDSHQENIIADQHVANTYHFSLRAYASILYLRIPQSFRIILRGHVVDYRIIANNLIYPEVIVYRPQIGENKEAVIITTIGFLKEAPHVNIHGFNIYHRNRLILPFWKVLRSTCGIGRGVVGVLEANFIEPTHDKQDFERTSLFQKLEARLKEMMVEYWHLHSGLLGYHSRRKTPSALLPIPSSEQLLAPSQNSPRADSPGAVPSEDGSVQGPAATSCVNYTESDRLTSTDEICNIVEQKHVEGLEILQQDPQVLSLIEDNDRLRSEILELEKREQELNLKVQRLKRELEDAENEYVRLLAESESMEVI